MIDRSRIGAVERRLPLAVIVTLMLQSAAALLWVGSADERLSSLEARVVMEAADAERIARLEEQAAYMRTSLDRIERKLDAYHARRDNNQ